MRIERYGVTLRRIEIEDIEIVRKWRNSERVKKNMFFQEYITPEMQRKWFDTINNFNNSYYIIEYNNEKVGLINVKNSESDFTESGLFLFDDKFYNTFIPVIASVILLDTGFFIFTDKTSYIKIKKDNVSAIKYNYDLGYYLYEDKEDYIIMAINKKSFEEKIFKIRKAISNLYKNEYLKFTLEPVDFENGVAQKYMPFIDTIPQKIIKKKDFSGDNKYIIFNI